MQADQAAGLRSKHSRPRPQVVSLFSVQASLATRLARALQTPSCRVLLIDHAGRHSLATKTQSIFGWEQQVARLRLQTISVDGIDILHAPGAQAGDAAIVQAGKDYDYVLFDGQNVQPGTVALDHRTKQMLIIEVSALPDAVCNVYALLKTLHENKLKWRVILWGDPALCERVVSALHYFKRASSGLVEIVDVEADAHLTSLAARISAAEKGASPFHPNIGGESAQHG